MPYVQAFPSWVAVNNANFSSPTGLTDQYTGQPYTGGALNVGDYCDFTNDSAATSSYTKNGILYAGRYRYVQVDSGATAANVKTGTVGYVRAGSTVKSVVITNAGTGATAGTYSITATAGSGGGAGAVISVTVGSGGTIVSAVVTNGGYGYVSVPTFSLTATGTSGGAVAGQLSTTANLVTSYDQVSGGTAVAVRPVVFLNSITPGNYGFIQELGVATVLGNAAIGSGAAVGNWVEVTTAGTVDAPSATSSPTTATVGVAVDLPVASNLFKIYMQNVPVVQD